jgi:Zn-dependent peptidase ImmA (M78 family)
MTKRVKATINPALLTWARTTAGYDDLSAAAEKLKVDEDQLAAWETGAEQPTISQLRKLAELYKRPLAVLYLPKPPMNFQPMHDFRRLPELGVRRFSPELTLEIRRAQERRQLALELFEEAGDAPAKFALEASIRMSPEAVGQSIRDALGIEYARQAKWREPRVAFLAWRSRIEELGVLVFQSSQVESDEASGIAYWADVLPFIIVNGKDAYSRRCFSLLHELVHLMLRQSGVSDLDVEGPRPVKDERIEVFCNQAAACALMPHRDFLAEPHILAKGSGRHEWLDGEVGSLAATYSVSREAIIRRLLTFDRTTEDFYRRKRLQYAVEFQQQKLQEKAKNAGKPIPRNMPRETVANYGKLFVRRVIEHYHLDRLTLSEVSGYLGVKARHVPGIEEKLGSV